MLFRARPCSAVDENIPIGLITRARAKMINQQVNSLLVEFDFCLHKNWLLPNASILIVIRFMCEADGMPKEDNTCMERK